ncbi:MAG TPA: hypothetical protein VJ180_08625 [Pyrinomonadaceae bacterium]|nr:hypothetical protein [Pyrinomonadaceae bacterium]
MRRFLFILKPSLPVNPAGPIVETVCSACGHIRSRRGALECDLDGRDKFVCAGCVAIFDDADRVADEVLMMTDLGGAA